MYDDFEDQDWEIEAAENAPASSRQLAFLKRLGHSGPWNLTLEEASDLIDAYVDSRDNGLPMPDAKEIREILGRENVRGGSGSSGGRKKKKTAHKKRGCLVSLIVWTWRFFWILVIALGLFTLGLFIYFATHAS